MQRWNKRQKQIRTKTRKVIKTKADTQILITACPPFVVLMASVNLCELMPLNMGSVTYRGLVLDCYRLVFVSVCHSGTAVVHGASHVKWGGIHTKGTDTAAGDSHVPLSLDSFW